MCSCMARYHLHVHCDDRVAEDEDGIECFNLEAAREEALKGARSILADDMMRGQIDLRGRIDIADDTDSVVETIRFEDAVKIVC